MAKILGDYHTRASTGTTLFILHKQLSTGSIYKYSTPGLTSPTCWQRAFIAQDSAFAWIDISAMAHEIQPVTANFPVLTTPMQDLKFFAKDQGKTIDTLAALIHRSGEAFNQFPFSASSPPPQSAAHQPDTVPLYNDAVEIVGITICVEDEAKGHSLCEHDLAINAAALKVSRMYSDSKASITFNAVKFGLNDEAELAHAFFSSIHHSSSSTVTIIDSNELLFWLGSSRKVRELIAGFSRAGTTVVPVFVLKMPPSAATFFDVPGQRSVVTMFTVPAGSSKNLKWPANVVLYARSVDLALDAEAETETEMEMGKSDEAMTRANIDIRRFPMLHCGDGMLSAGPADEVVKDELRDGIKSAIWGFAAGGTHTTHFSGSTRGLVEDYLWHTPVPLRLTDKEIPINTGESFADKRAVPRLRFIYHAEHVLRQFVDILHQASSVHPPINSTLLFELEVSESTASAGASAAAAAGFSKKTPSAVKKLTAIRKSPKSPGLLSDFLTHMDLAASGFSHMDFLMALQSLNNAEKLVDKLRKRMLVILNTRSGVLDCNTREVDEREELQAMYLKLQSMRTAMFSESNQVPDGDKSTSEETERENISVKETSESMFGQYAWLVKILLGMAAGAFAGMYARNMQEKYRKHYL